MSNQPGTWRSGKPRSAVEIAFAWISAPDMFSPLDVEWTS